jgi:hypothetical protein
VLQDPRYELGDPGADPGEVRFGASDAPGDDPSEEVVAVLAAHLQWTPRVSLAGVSTAGLVARAQEDLRDEFVSSGAEEHALAAVVAHDGDLDLERAKRKGVIAQRNNMLVHLVVRGIYDLRSVGTSVFNLWTQQKKSHFYCVIESCTDILTTSYWLHVELGKNIKKISMSKN